MIEETGKTSKQFEFTLISTSGKSDIFVIRILDILCFLSLTTIPLILVFSLIKIAIFWHRESINNIRSNKIFQSMIILFIYQQLGADPGLWRNSESMGHCCLPAFSIHRFLNSLGPRVLRAKLVEVEQVIHCNKENAFSLVF